jgi:hypothetical protein
MSPFPPKRKILAAAHRIAPDRVQPRVRKRRPKQYPLMTRLRAELRKALLKQRSAA